MSQNYTEDDKEVIIGVEKLFTQIDHLIRNHTNVLASIKEEKIQRKQVFDDLHNRISRIEAKLGLTASDDEKVSISE